MVITSISIPALLPYGQVLHHTNFVPGAGSGDARAYMRALFEILTLIAGVGMAVTLHPVLKRQSESLALGYVTVRVVESPCMTRRSCSARPQDIGAARGTVGCSKRRRLLVSTTRPGADAARMMR